MVRDDYPNDNAPDTRRYRRPSYAARDRGQWPRGRATSRDWERLSADPDPERDLGYRIERWESFRADDGRSVMFLPSDEELLRSDAFVIADERSVCDVHDRI